MRHSRLTRIRDRQLCKGGGRRGGARGGSAGATTGKPVKLNADETYYRDAAAKRIAEYEKDVQQADPQDKAYFQKQLDDFRAEKEMYDQAEKGNTASLKKYYQELITSIEQANGANPLGKSSYSRTAQENLKKAKKRLAQLE